MTTNSQPATTIDPPAVPAAPADKAEQAKIASVINRWYKPDITRKNSMTTSSTPAATTDPPPAPVAPVGNAEQAKTASVVNRWFKFNIGRKTSTATSSTPAATTAPAPVPAVPADKVEQAKIASVINRWYKWNKVEQKERDSGKKLWYIAQQLKEANKLASTTNITTTDARKDNDEKAPAIVVRDIEAVPSYSLRSTAIYSPPYGDRILSGRLELMTDSSGFKFYRPDERLKQPAGDHSRSTMYKMNTSSKKTPLPLPSTLKLNATDASGGANPTEDRSALQTYVSRGLQTDLEPEPADLAGTPHIRYYEKQQPTVILIGKEPSSVPILPPIEKTPVWVNDRPLNQTSLTPTVKETIPAVAPDNSALSSEAHDKALEELRKRHKDTKGGTFRVKKVHILEKSDVKNSQPAPAAATARTPSKASESILRSENLFFNRLFRRKK